MSGAVRCRCPQCGHGFDVFSKRDWGYRDGSTYYCSWKCLREHDAKIPPHPIDEEPAPAVPQVLPQEIVDRVREGVEHECELEVSSAPVRTAYELRREAEIADVYDRARRRGRTPRDVMAKAVRQYVKLTQEEGRSAKEAADIIGIPRVTLFRWFQIMKNELGLTAISREECGKRRAAQAKAKKAAGEPQPEPPAPEPEEPDEHSEPAEVNRSGEKLARLNACRARIRALLDEGEGAAI